MSLNFNFLVKNHLKSKIFYFQKINSLLDYNCKNKAIFVDFLDPDYYLLFPHIEVIISRKGSVLSHLSILAREQKISILQCNWPKKIFDISRVKIDIEKTNLIFYNE